MSRPFAFVLFAFTHLLTSGSHIVLKCWSVALLGNKATAFNFSSIRLERPHAIRRPPPTSGPILSSHSPRNFLAPYFLNCGFAFRRLMILWLVLERAVGCLRLHN